MNRKLFDAQIAQYDTPTVSNEGSIKLEDNIRCYLPYLKIDGNTYQYQGEYTPTKIVDFTGVEYITGNTPPIIAGTSAIVVDNNLNWKVTIEKTGTEEFSDFFIILIAPTQEDLLQGNETITIYEKDVGSTDTIVNNDFYIGICNPIGAISDPDAYWNYFINNFTVTVQLENSIQVPNPGQVKTVKQVDPAINIIDGIEDSLWTASLWVVSGSTPVELPKQDKIYKVWVDEEQFKAQASTFAYLSIFIGTSETQVREGSDENGISQTLASSTYGECTFKTLEMSENFYIGIGNDTSGISGYESTYWEALCNIGVYIQTLPYDDICVSAPSYSQPIQNVGDFASEVEEDVETGLPIEYQRIEYIESTGTQYINTGVWASENNSFEVKAQLVHTNTTSQTIWGGRQSSSVMQSNQLSCTKSSGVFQFACGNTTSVSKLSDTNLHIFKSDKNLLYIDGELVYTVTSAQITAQNNVYLFATNTAGTIDFHGGDLKMYYCKIWNEDTLIRDYIPCYRKSDNAVGMYDLVTNEFYTNVGTGEFVKGDSISRLPSEYQELSYIESTGTQYVNIDYVLKSSSKIETTCAITSDLNNGNRAIWGAYNNSIYHLLGTNSTVNGWIVQLGGNWKEYSLKDNLKHSHIVDLKNKQYIIDDNIYDISDVTHNFHESSLFLFARNYGDTTIDRLSAIKLYRARIWDNDVLVRDFIPCYRKTDNEVGLYDLANGVFYTNAGTGEFVKGDNISKLPSKYQEVEYIESTGTQIIDTGFCPTNKTKVSMDIMFSDLNNSNTNHGFCGVSDGTNVFAINFGGTAGEYSRMFIWTNVLYAAGGTIVDCTSNDDTLNNRNTLTFGSGIFKYGTYTRTPEISSWTSMPNSLPIFGQLTSSGEMKPFNRYHLTMYSCKIWDNDVLVRDFVPCYRKSDNELGMYDTINNVFYVNVGTGEFIKGDDIKNETNIENKIIVEFRGKNLFNINNYTPLTNYDSTITLGFDISNLVIGEKYIFTSNLPITWFKISNTKSGNNSVQYNSNSGFTKFSFTMSRHANISEDKTQYLILATTGLNAISDISELDGYNIQIEQVSTSGINLLNTQRTLDRSYGISSRTNNKITVNKLYGDATNYLVYSKVYKAGTYAISAKKTSSSNSYVRLLTTSQISGSTYNSYYKAYYSTFITSDKDSAIISFTSNSDFQIGFNFNGTKDTSIEIYDIRLCKMDLKYEPYVEPILIGIPTSITVGGSVVPLRFAKVDKSDYLEVDRVNGTVKYVRNIAYGKFPHANAKHTYINMNGVYAYDFAEQSMTRAKGICTHTDKVGNYINTVANSKNAIWIGVNSVVIYWIGILDTLGLTTVEEFNTWLDEQEAQGTPVELIYEMKAPITYDLTDTDFGQELLNFATKNGANIFEIKTDVKPTLTAKYLTHK